MHDLDIRRELLREWANAKQSLGPRGMDKMVGRERQKEEEDIAELILG